MNMVNDAIGYLSITWYLINFMFIEMTNNSTHHRENTHPRPQTFTAAPHVLAGGGDNPEAHQPRTGCTKSGTSGRGTVG